MLKVEKAFNKKNNNYQKSFYLSVYGMKKYFVKIVMQKYHNFSPDVGTKSFERQSAIILLQLRP